MVAQNIAMQRPDLVRRLIIVGRGPRNGDNMSELTPEAKIGLSKEYADPDDFWIDGFFTQSPKSLAAGYAFLRRRDARIKDRDIPISDKVRPAQAAAFLEWGSLWAGDLPTSKR